MKTPAHPATAEKANRTPERWPMQERASKEHG